MPTAPKIRLLAGSASVALGTALGQELGLACEFPCTYPVAGGELKFDCEKLEHTTVCIIQSTYAPTNHHWMELLLMIGAAKRAGARHIIAIIPYYAYARDDRHTLTAKLLKAAGAHQVIICEPHSPHTGGCGDIPVHVVHSTQLLKDYLKGELLEDRVVISPDAGGAKRASMYAHLLNCPMGLVLKERHGKTVHAHTLLGEVQGKDVWIIDDMADSGQTLAAAAQLVASHKPRSISAFVTHGLWSHTACMQHNHLQRILTTDTIPQTHPVTVLSIAPLIAKVLHQAALPYSN